MNFLTLNDLFNNQERREIIQLSKCNHPNIVRYYSSWFELEEDDIESNSSRFSINTAENSLNTKVMFICMELCDGNLSHWLELQPNIRKSMRIEKKITYDLISAVEYIHTKSIIHRDIKPSNILTNSVDGKIEVKLSDFGSAKEIDVQNSTVSSFHTTPSYAAPEILSKGYSFPVDIYSLGLVIFQIFGFFESPEDFFSNLNDYQNSNNFPSHIRKQYPYIEQIIRRMINFDAIKRPTASELYAETNNTNKKFDETKEILNQPLNNQKIKQLENLLQAKERSIEEMERLQYITNKINQDLEKSLHIKDEIIKDLENRITRSNLSSNFL